MVSEVLSGFIKRGEYLGVKKSLEDRKYQNQTDPLFTYLSFQSAQQPMQAPFEYQELYSHIGDKKRRNYAACVTALDDAIGQVVDLYKGKYRKFLEFVPMKSGSKILLISFISTAESAGLTSVHKVNFLR